MVDATELDGMRATGGAVTRRVLFGTVGAQDVTEAVVRRIRGAIALGVLHNGERLPREADLVESLGVTTHALRESLAVLREEDLIVTRAGRGGGSFVQTPTDSSALAQAALCRLSASELRDLGDWRRMLVAGSAFLAAQRGSEDNAKHLREHAAQLGTAGSAGEARLHHGRFHLELAAAAQSLRLSKAEFGIQEELDWMLGVSLADAGMRRSLSAGLLAIADAVVQRRAGEARAAAETHSVELVEMLTRHRLELLSYSSGAATPRTGRSSLVQALRDVADDIVGPLERLAGTCGPYLARPSTGDALRSQTLTATLACLQHITFPVHGLGILSEVGVVSDDPYWLDWWHRTETGPVRDLSHVTDPSRGNWYNYADREYMTRPRKDRAKHAAGPYVDYGGVDDYIITIAVPIIREDAFLGVAAADVLVSDLERRIAPWLARAKTGTLVLNEDLRVVASNTSSFPVGDVARDVEQWRSTTVGWLGWQVRQAPRASSRALTSV